MVVRDSGIYILGDSGIIIWGRDKSSVRHRDCRCGLGRGLGTSFDKGQSSGGNLIDVNVDSRCGAIVDSNNRLDRNENRRGFDRGTGIDIPAAGEGQQIARYQLDTINASWNTYEVAAASAASPRAPMAPRS